MRILNNFSELKTEDRKMGVRDNVLSSNIKFMNWGSVNIGSDSNQLNQLDVTVEHGIEQRSRQPRFIINK